MVNICPYCGEEHRALKNHVRLTSGDGHGPSGQYPEDFPGAPDQDDRPDPGGGLDVAPALDEDPDPDAPPEPAGGGGAVAVEAVADAEEQSEPDEDESLIAMPESELNTMLQEAAQSVTPDSGESEQETTDDASADDDGPVVKPVAAAEQAEDEGWSLGVVLLVFILTVLAGLAWGYITDKAENGRERAQQLTSTGGYPAPGV